MAFAVPSDSCRSWGKVVLLQAPAGTAWHGTAPCLTSTPANAAVPIVRMDRGQGTSRFTLSLVALKGMAISHPAVSLARAWSLWLGGSPCLGGGSALQLHQAFRCFLALRVAAGAVAAPVGAEYSAVSQAGKAVPSSHCI